MLSFQLPPGYELPKPRTDRLKLNQNNFKWALLYDDQRQLVAAVGYIDFLYDIGRELYVPALGVHCSDDTDQITPFYRAHQAITAHWQQTYGEKLSQFTQSVTDAFFDPRRAVQAQRPDVPTALEEMASALSASDGVQVAGEEPAVEAEPPLESVKPAGRPHTRAGRSGSKLLVAPFDEEQLDLFAAS